MLSRVADSLYWMGRYFERADNCARVLDATQSLILSRVDATSDQRWFRALGVMGLPPGGGVPDPQEAIRRLATDGASRSSVLGSLAASRENASQVRNEISSEMWEQVNRLYHHAVALAADADDDESVMRLVAAVREGSYAVHGVAETTMTHGEGWRFVQLGTFTERACAVSMLLDAYFGMAAQCEDLDWVALLASCAAFDSYCKVFTADLQPDRVLELLLIHPEFPYSVRYSASRMSAALKAITAQSAGRQRARIIRTIGRVQSSLAFTTVPELVAGDLHTFLHGIVDGCRTLHAAVHDAYIDYPIDIALDG